MRRVRLLASWTAAVLLTAALSGCGGEQYKNEQAPDNNVNQMIEGMKQGPGGPTTGTQGGGTPPGTSAMPPTVPSGGGQ
jgi:hypothetical protein